ncbi:hypothetical protein ACJMK2_040644 [Sinanodonta woodiana]|uniref:BHLH domain-containing protein n=1 Tax=Sinanodonta woodiana TaxID=1069815 RepID=A0ABD3W1N4_SINWO
MKAVNEACARSEFGINQDFCKIAKPKLDDYSEMKACFSKLKELVPTVPHHRKISKTALLQHVIDYIMDLEVALEFHPSMFKNSSPSLREPLTEKVQPNTILDFEVFEDDSSDDLSDEK